MDLQLRTILGGGGQRQRNQVSFRGVDLAGLSVFIGSGGVEIAQAHRAQIVSAAVGLERVFEKKFRRAIRIHRLARQFSGVGIRLVKPYTAHEEENTKRRIPASSTQFSRLSPPATLLRKYFRGFATDSPT